MPQGGVQEDERGRGDDARAPGAAQGADDRGFAVAGGERKYTAVRAAVRGRWITALITDIATARRLLDEP